MADKKPEEAAPAAAPAGGGGIKAWLPLIVTLVAMPALAFGTMNFLILPRMQKAGGSKPAAEAKEGGGGHGTPEAESGHGEKPEPAEAHGEPEPAKEAKAGGGHGGGGETEPALPSTSLKRVRFEKVIANVKDTQGTRYIMATIVVAGPSSKFEKIVGESKDQLLDIATTILGNKSIADLGKQDARTQIKIELMSVFNTALGQNLVKEIWIPEWAIQ